MIATWKNLEQVEKLDQLTTDSNHKPVVLFKHSTRCGISQHAMHRLESEWDLDENEVDFYYLDLLRYRDISNEIAAKYKVVHQSPQIIVLKNERVIFHSSHHAISIPSLKKALG